LTTIVSKRHRQIEQFVDTEKLRATPRIVLPGVRVADGAHGSAISPKQAIIVANNAGRALCKKLAPYVELLTETSSGSLQVQLVVTAITPTSSAAAGASWALSNLVQIPLIPTRMPAGLGGLSIEADIRDASGQVAMMRWARGANAATQEAKMSVISDAWELAEAFGNEFGKTVLDTDMKKRGVQRDRVPSATARANRELCVARYGRINLARRGASMLLPILTDEGPPTARIESETGAGAEATVNAGTDAEG
jgi:hypothetical protein